MTALLGVLLMTVHLCHKTIASNIGLVCSQVTFQLHPINVVTNFQSFSDEQPVSSTPLVLRGGRSSRHSSLRRSIFSRPTDHDSADDPPSNNMSYVTPNKPIPMKLNDYFDAIASDSD